MTSSLDMIRGRSNIVTLTNNSGGALVAGDVCIQDTSADEKATTTTSAASVLKVFIAAEAIAAGAAGRFYESGYCPFVNVNASVTRGRFLFTHTVVKQAAENATYGSGAFGKILKSGTTPSAIIYSATAQISGSGVTRTGSTTDNHLAVWDGSNADTIKDGGAAGGSLDGWTAATGTWTYSSADAPTYVISVNADMTTTIGVGQRIKLTDTTVKYFIVTAVGVFGGGATLITVDGGTDYTLSGGAITLPYYSMHKAPFGFPLAPTKWTVEVTDVSDREQASPTQDTWYNPGSISISIPIGCRRIIYKCALEVAKNATATMLAQATLSTANNSESDVDFTRQIRNTGAAAAGANFADGALWCEKIISVVSKTTYYLNIRSNIASAATVGIRGDLEKTIIRAINAYL